MLPAPLEYPSGDWNGFRVYRPARGGRLCDIPVNSTDLSSTLLISDPKIAVYWLSTWFKEIYWLATDFADFEKSSIFFLSK